MVITFEECPEALQDAVNEAFARYNKYDWNPKITAVEKYETTPYKDKTIIEIKYAVYVEVINAIEVFRFSINDTYKHETVSRDSMIIGDITAFIRHSKEFRDWIRYDWEKAESGNK